MNEKELQEYLQHALDLEVDLVVTDNRRNMISSRRVDLDRMVVRVHRMFLEATPKVARSLASFCHRPTPSNRKAVGEFIRQNRGMIRKELDSPSKAAPKAYRPTQKLGGLFSHLPWSKKPEIEENAPLKGQYHDLEKLYEKVNRRFFKGKCTAQIRWGQAGPRRRRKRSINLGTYNYETNTIRIHPALDQSFVPAYVVELVLYHEMLHWYIPPKQVNNRNCFHSRFFRESEQAHPQYEKAEKWKKSNLNRLLKS